MPQLNEDGYGKKRSHCRQNSSPCKCTAVCFSTQAYSIYLSTQALSLRELRILLRRWSRINFLDYISWKNTNGLLQWTFNHISPSTALQHFQGRLSFQEDQKFFEIDLIFVYKGNLLLHFFAKKKKQWCQSQPDQYIIFKCTSIKAENPDTLDNIFGEMQPGSGVLKMFVNLNSHFTSFSHLFGRRTATRTGPGAFWMLPMPIRAWPWISIRDSMPTGMSQRDLSRVLTFCGVCTNKLGEQRRFSKIGGFGLCRFPTF